MNLNSSSADPSNYRIINDSFVFAGAGVYLHFVNPYPRCFFNSIMTTLTCDAHVANRYIILTLHVAGLFPFRFVDPVPLVANESRQICAFPSSLYLHPLVAGTVVSLPLPTDVELSIGDELIIDLINFQVGDDFTPTYYQLKTYDTL